MISDHRAARAHYDRLSRWYDLIGGSSERPARMRGLQMLAVRPGERVLEIGCGTGASLLTLASAAGRAGCVIGLDLSAGMLRVARDRAERQGVPNVACLQGDGACLPFYEAAFDVIFMSFTLELFPAAEIPLLLRECKRALRPAGRMGVVSLLQTDRPGWIERAYNRAHRRWPAVIDCRPIPIGRLLELSGFAILHMAEQSMQGLKVGIAVAELE